MENPIKIKFFVSYRKKDNYFSVITNMMQEALNSVQREYADDDTVVIDYFIDDDKLMTGMNWQAAILTQVHDSNVFVPIYTPTYFADNIDEEGIDWCEREYEEFKSVHPEAFTRAETTNATALSLPFVWKKITGASDSNRYRDLKKIQGYDLSSEVENYEQNNRKANLYKKLILDAITAELKRAVTILQESNKNNAVAPPADDSSPSSPEQAEPLKQDVPEPEHSESHIKNDIPATSSAKVGSQDHSASSEAHELVVRIYNTLANKPFANGDAVRESEVNSTYFESGVLESIALTADRAHPTQGINFNRNTDAPAFYISGSWSGFPNDGFIWCRPDKEGGGVKVIPKSKGPETYGPWRDDFDNMLGHYIAMIRRAAVYRRLDKERGSEWESRWEKFLSLGPRQGKSLYAGGWFLSANTRFEFVRNGKLVPLTEIDTDVLNRPIIDMTNADEVDEVIRSIEQLHNSGAKYFRQGARFDTQTDATNCLKAIKEYRDFLRD